MKSTANKPLLICKLAPKTGEKIRTAAERKTTICSYNYKNNYLVFRFARDNCGRMADSTQLPTLYHYPNSRSTKILWLCKEYKIPVNVSAISLPMRENKSSWYLKINPNGTVPTWTIADGSEHITDSAEIMKHVVETNKLKFTGTTHT